MRARSSSFAPGRGSADLDHAAPDFLAGGGEMGALMRAYDWASTPLGPVAGWSPTLRTTLRTMLANRFPHILWWGPRHIQLYNDAYIPIPGDKHPARAFGVPGEQGWSEIWHIIGPLVERPFQGGPPTWDDDILLEINRHGFLEETHFTVAYSPVPDDTVPSGIGGVLGTVHEITEKVIGERRVLALRDLAGGAAEAKTAEEACVAAAAILSAHPRDIPFALIYLLDGRAGQARLAGSAGVTHRSSVAPSLIDLLEGADGDLPWPIAGVVRSERIGVVEGLEARFGAAVPAGPWADPPRQAVVVPIRSNRAHELAGVLVAGVSPRLALDELYRSFLELVAGQIATAVAGARSYEEERRRAEALAELDRAKTAFFSNVSHEFRTPLTLMLGPLEEALRRPAVAGEARAELTVAHRNGLRLLKLVNSQLDFSRVEAGRAKAVYQATDLASLTAELASNVRSACERAGLRLVVDCPPLPQPVHVDREMWEKVVLNLLSNAFKFTFEGEIAVAIRAEDGHAVLTVRDTGIGIPATELPRVFDRFHRVADARGRTHEGTGIGLALVQELVKLHGGTVQVASAYGEGATFTVRVPFGTDHLPADQVGTDETQGSMATRAEAYVEEALRWLPGADGDSPAPAGMLPGAAPSAPTAGLDRARVLLADDNADMRDYVRRLLSARYEVEAVADGQAALAAARARRPDLVLSDVMMPRLDGFGLLQALRDESGLREVPVVLLSARAGEEAQVEGLEAGADDYLVKPFSGRELVARVQANLDMAKLRRQAAEALRESEERHRLILESAKEYAIVTLDAEGRITSWNAGAERIMGYHETEVIGQPAAIFFTPEDRTVGAPDQELERARAEGRSGDERWQLRKDGSRFWGSGVVMPLADGHRRGYLKIFRDLTEEKRASEEAEAARQRQLLLLEELNHRVKNTLAIVQSIAAQTLRSGDAPERFPEAFQSRLRALAQVHDLLARGQWQGTSLHEVAEMTLAPVEGQRRITIDGPSVALAPGVAVSLHLALHELATNAVKHGALSLGSGRVDLSWRVLRDGAAPALRIVWQEAGGPLVAPPSRRGFGSRLIERGLAHELDGEVELEFDRAGVRCRVTVPLSARIGAA
ncbi:MAG TPA: ATP-binding protein [Geminicoccaceae bacterium]|nr:ATP-binding protein [Geminicoccaceae bacterium]